MFRKMRRSNQQLTDEECAALLKSEKRGVLAVNGDGGYPYALPMNFIYDEPSGKIYFHGSGEGHKIDALRRSSKASFCVYDGGYRKEGDWAFTVKSVIVFGKIRFVDDAAERISLLKKLGAKYYPSPEITEEEVRKAGHVAQMLELTPNCMTGKRVHES